ncbi:cystathionine gamma-synthase [Peniophora sp. CONT]|nr:cystathionine gamma-synthase [Peniophora sp. CONT]
MTSKDFKLRGTDLLHADDVFHTAEVAASISVTTTFRHTDDPKTDGREPTAHEVRDAKNHLYSRLSQPTYARAERVLSAINGGFALTYASGLAATLAALNFYQPKRIAITGGYYGVHLVIDTWKRGRDLEIVDLDVDDYTGVDLCWVETPLNPTGEARNIQYYADKIHAVGGHLVIDATFAPPPLQYPFKWGADMIMHSGSKYFGGHSDLLCGVLYVKTIDEWHELTKERLRLGNVMGSLESWLLLRSLRTLHLRVPRQSSNATTLAQWLHRLSKIPAGQSFDGVPGGLIAHVWHSSLQSKDAKTWSPVQQMEGGGSPTFAILMEKPEHAALLPMTLEYFTDATSLGGVESLIEQRAKSSPGEDPRLIRISLGVEDIEDLKEDFRRALSEIVQAKAKL